MNIDFFPKDEQIQKFKDLESVLLTRRKNGKVAGNLAMVSFIVQALIIGLPLMTKIIPFIEDGLFNRYGEYLRDFRIFIPLFVGIFFFAIYFLFRRTSILLRETSEPFRYTFFVEPFKQVENIYKGDFELKNIQRLNLLHHDLTELINNRIKRFSILKEMGKSDNEKPNLTDTRKSNHIQIYGHFAIREDKDNDDWIIHIMPYIRIGAENIPATLAQPVRYPLTGDDTPDILDTREYNQLLERVYSQVTTEVYDQIEKDIRDKINLFPTAYLQAKAYYYEAEDMAKSNTINSFDSAIQLYKEAIKKCDFTWQRQWIGILIKLPLIKLMFYKYLYQYAHILNGHAKCLIYKKRISALSGRKTNAIFEIRHNLKEIIGLLEYFLISISKNKENLPFRRDRKTFFNLAYFSFPPDSWYRKMLLQPSNQLFNDARKLLFEAYVIHALSDTFLHTLLSARMYLNKAQAIAPDLSTSHVLYILAEGYLEPNIEKALLIFQKVTEKDPSFQIAQFDLAYWTEMKFRKDGNIDKNRARSVLEEYDKVLKINPGNIAALAAQGYILWLLKDFDQARRKFQEGIEIKALVSETYIGLLIYGLARIKAEQGYIYQSYELFSQAIAANPNVGAFTMNENDSWIVSSFYDFITPGLAKRYEEYLENFNDYKNKKMNIIGFTEDNNNELENILEDNNPKRFPELLKKLKLLSGAVEINGGKQPKQWQMVVKQNDTLKNYRKETYEVRKIGSKIELSNQPADAILNAVFSFVQNDLGNATMNYYKRYGGADNLDNAIGMFAKSIAHNNDNIVAKYNKSLALAKTGSESDSIKLLDEVFQNCPHWIDAWALYLEFYVKASGSFKIYKDKVRDIEKKIEEDEEKEKKGIMKEMGAPEKSDRRNTKADEKRDSNDDHIRGENTPKNDRLKTGNDEKRKSSYIDSLRAKRAELIKEGNEKVLEIIRRIVGSTNLITLYSGFQLEDLDSSKIEEFIAKKINWIRLDEDDVRAFRIYASWFYHDKCQINDKKIDKPMFVPVMKIFDHLLTHYYPEDFDILLKKKKVLIDASEDPKFMANLKSTMKSTFLLSQNYILLSTVKVSASSIRKLNEGDLSFEIRQHLFDNGIVLPPNNNWKLEFVKDGYLLSGMFDKEKKYLLKRNGREVAVYLSAIQHCDDAMEALIRYRIEMDPINYEQLAYSAEILKPEKHMSFLEKALQLSYDNLELYKLYYKTSYKAGKLNDFVEKFEYSGHLTDLPAIKAAVYLDIGNFINQENKNGGKVVF
jgi:hypothetical protein